MREEKERERVCVSVRRDEGEKAEFFFSSSLLVQKKDSSVQSRFRQLEQYVSILKECGEDL
jgi:hypothetical protein